VHGRGRRNVIAGQFQINLIWGFRTIYENTKNVNSDIALSYFNKIMGQRQFENICATTDSIHCYLDAPFLSHQSFNFSDFQNDFMLSISFEMSKKNLIC
jgi:hypothetical protein